MPYLCNEKLIEKKKTLRNPSFQHSKREFLLGINFWVLCRSFHKLAKWNTNISGRISFWGLKAACAQPPQCPGLTGKGAFIKCLLKMNKHRGKANGLLCLLAQDLSTTSPRFMSPKLTPLKPPFFQETVLSPYCECSQVKLAEGQGFHCRWNFRVLWSLVLDRDVSAPK